MRMDVPHQPQAQIQQDRAEHETLDMVQRNGCLAQGAPRHRGQIADVGQHDLPDEPLTPGHSAFKPICTNAAFLSHHAPVRAVPFSMLCPSIIDLLRNSFPFAMTIAFRHSRRALTRIEILKSGSLSVCSPFGSLPDHVAKLNERILLPDWGRDGTSL